MYITQHYTPDCPSEDDGRVVSKGKTLKQAVDNTIKEDLDDSHMEEVSYDSKYIYVGENPYYKIQKI
jgi:hypothetical protein